MPYLSLSDYGLIGNPASAALVSRLGSIDWCCFPDLDSSSHFAALLDDSQGGKFQLMPQGDFRSEQRYLQRTQVLETAFETPFGRAILTDWMPMEPGAPVRPVVYRRIEMTHGKIPWLLVCSPRFHYGRDPALAELYRGGILFRGPSTWQLALLRGSRPMEISANGASAVARFSMESGEAADFAWEWGIKDPAPFPAQPAPTVEAWRGWAHRCGTEGCTFSGPWHDAVVRSALLLRTLMHPTGSIAESATTSLPGKSGSSRTWDYRFAWIRDGAQAIAALAGLGYRGECNALFQWLSDIIGRDGVEGLQPVYRLDGGRSLPEEEISTLSGHQDSRPVRVGNLSSTFFQLDVYGHVMTAAAEYFRIFGELPATLWPKLIDVADYVCQAWRRPDHGIWEMRSKPEHFLGSKLYCWAALDRAIGLAKALGERSRPRWASEREILHRTILSQGFDSAQGSFIRSFGNTELDSAALLIPLLGLLPMNDPRVVSTMGKIEARLCQGALLHRYEGSDGLEGNGGFYLSSSLLLVRCLASAGRVDEAGERLAELCGYATGLGILGEQVDPVTSETTGNVPSASAHIGLINASLSVGLARGKQAQGERPAGLTTELPEQHGPGKAAQEPKRRPN